MEAGGSMPHSQGLSNNPYPEPNHPNYSHLWSILILSSHLRLGLPKGLFLVSLPVKILKAFLPSSILATMPCPSQSSRFNHPDYISSLLPILTLNDPFLPDI